MDDFTKSKTIDGLSVKLWRGERMVLIGMDVDNPEPDFVGFSIEEQSPGSDAFCAAEKSTELLLWRSVGVDGRERLPEFPVY